LLGAAAGEPVVIVAAATNRGMAIVADAKSDIKTIKDLKGNCEGLRRFVVWEIISCCRRESALTKVPKS